MKNYLIALTSILAAQTPITSIPFEFYGDHIMFKIRIDDSKAVKLLIANDGVSKEFTLTLQSLID